MMGEIQHVKIGETEDGEPILQRQMTAEQVRERADMNVQVTASSMHARVKAYSNGHNGHGPVSPDRLTSL